MATLPSDALSQVRVQTVPQLRLSLLILQLSDFDLHDVVVLEQYAPEHHILDPLCEHIPDLTLLASILKRLLLELLQVELPVC